MASADGSEVGQVSRQKAAADSLAGQAGVQAGMKYIPAMRQALREAHQMTDVRAQEVAIANGTMARPGIDVGSSFAVRGPGYHHDLVSHEKAVAEGVAAREARIARAGAAGSAAGTDAQAQNAGMTDLGGVSVDNARLLRDVPVGAVVLDRHGRAIAFGHNRRNADGDPLAHAELEAMHSAAARLYNWNLSDCTLVVTLEPCPMCAGAAVMAHIGRIVFGAWDPKMGACGSVWSIPTDPHIGAKPEVIGGVLEEDCQKVLTDFFARLRGTAVGVKKGV